MEESSLPSGHYHLLPQGLDFFNVTFSFLVVLAVAVQIIYILSPQALKKIYERWDYDSNAPRNINFSSTGILATVFLALSLIFIIQSAALKIDRSQALQERGTDKEYRHRSQWMVESCLYQNIIISALWLSIHQLMKINRERRAVYEDIEVIRKGGVKQPVQNVVAGGKIEIKNTTTTTTTTSSGVVDDSNLEKPHVYKKND